MNKDLPYRIELVSVVIPVFNEAPTIVEIIRRVQSVPVATDIIVVDDGSSDGTAEAVAALAEAGEITLITHPVNRGKGASIRTGLERVRGDVIVVQDADLEYDPRDYCQLLDPIQRGLARVVYGSRFRGSHRAMYFWHAVGNKLLTLVCNALFDTTLTDMETGYKVMKADVARSITLRSERWGFDPEITAKILKRGERIYEVPISYAGREFCEGKKITWKDGLVVLFTLIRYRIRD